MSQLIPGVQPCKVGLLLAYVFNLHWNSRTKATPQSFGADHRFDDDHAEERKQKLFYFNWWNIALSRRLFPGTAVIVYIEDNVSWGVAGLIILTITMAITMATFYMGKPHHRHGLPEGSGMAPMLQVLVAAIRRRENYLILLILLFNIKPAIIQSKADF
ncbi:hypothetical protein OIU84_020773 [Salix udensis]|uniref:Uncharacterized protein n=1 Tax=Salix udensis TaxID=889485 RepID=A0AAD6KUL5_9ROSI|nr:hypothetical protein OIU84_020773 [Salix udensis]